MQDCKTGISQSCSVKISVTSSLGDIYDMALTQVKLSLTGAQTYTVSFRAKTTSSHQVSAAIQQNYSLYGHYASKRLRLAADGNWHQYSYTFNQPSSDSNGLLSLGVGA